MTDREREPSRGSPIRTAIYVGLCILAAIGIWLFDYAGKFELFITGRGIGLEIDAELARRGIECSEDLELVIPPEALNEISPPGRFVASLSLERGESGVEGVARMRAIEIAVPWLDDVAEGALLPIRLQCEPPLPLWCVPETRLIPRFFGAPVIGSDALPLDGGGVAVEASEHLRPAVADQDAIDAFAQRRFGLG